MSVAESEIQLVANPNVDQAITVDSSRVSDLSPLQLEAIALLVCGRRYRQVAELLGVGEWTICHWCRRDDVFRRELELRKEERYQSLLAKAYTRVDEHLDSDDPKIVARASETALEHEVGRMRAHSTLAITHTVLDDVRHTIAALPQEGDDQPALDAEYTASDTTGSSECTDNT